MGEQLIKRLGIVGLGNQANEHIRVNEFCQTGKIVAAFDPSITTCIDPKVQIVPSLADLLALNLDGIILAIPHHAYLETLKSIWSVIPSMPIGKEKPLGRSISEANAILAMAKAGGAPLHVFIQRRYHPSYEALKNLIKEHPIKPNTIHLEINLGFDRETKSEQTNNWRHSRQKSGGGALVDLGYHMIDLAMHLIGDFELVSCRLYEDGRLLKGDIVDDEAHLVGIADDTWITISSRVFKTSKSTLNQYPKKEQVIISYGDFSYVADRESIYYQAHGNEQNQQMRQVHKSDKSWQLAMVKQLEQFCLTIDKGSLINQDIIWDQQPVQSIIEAGYQFMSAWDLNDTYA